LPRLRGEPGEGGAGLAGRRFGAAQFRGGEADRGAWGGTGCARPGGDDRQAGGGHGPPVDDGQAGGARLGAGEARPELAVEPSPRGGCGRGGPADAGGPGMELVGRRSSRLPHPLWRGHRGGGILHCQGGLDGAARLQERGHERADDHRRRGGHGHRRGGGGRRDGAALFHRRAAGELFSRSRAQRGAHLDGPGARHGYHRAPRGPGACAGGRGAGWRADRRLAGGAPAHGWADPGGALGAQPGADHRGVDSRGQGAGRRGFRRVDQRDRRADRGGDAPGRGEHPVAHRPPGGRGAGAEGLFAAFRRPFCPRIHADRGGARRARRRFAAAIGLGPAEHLVLPGAGVAGDCLPLRAGDLYPCDHRERPGPRRAGGRADQGRTLPGGAGQAAGGGPGQDGNADGGQALCGGRRLRAAPRRGRGLRPVHGPGGQGRGGGGTLGARAGPGGHGVCRGAGAGRSLCPQRGGHRLHGDGDRGIGGRAQGLGGKPRLLPSQRRGRRRGVYGGDGGGTPGVHRPGVGG